MYVHTETKLVLVCKTEARFESDNDANQYYRPNSLSFLEQRYWNIKLKLRGRFIV